MRFWCCVRAGCAITHSTQNLDHDNRAEQLDLSRRKALKILTGVPMLPLGGLATASMLSACGGGDD
ncbi:hypothetical protein QMN58_27485, partial [Escherichia coli]|nr:hypothetical protein [Escherichia coli]